MNHSYVLELLKCLLLLNSEFHDSFLLMKTLSLKLYSSNFASVLYGCKTWSLALREEHKTQVLGGKILRNIFGDKNN
jgi:hypothetical protein